MKSLDEVLHVFDSHTARKLWVIKDEENLYSKAELLEIIAEVREEIEAFQNDWLVPILDELDDKRKTEFST